VINVQSLFLRCLLVFLLFPFTRAVANDEFHLPQSYFLELQRQTESHKKQFHDLTEQVSKRQADWNLEPVVDEAIHSSLDAYLKQLGYRRVALRRLISRNEMYAVGVVGSRKQIFLVNSGMSMTSADREIARDVKSLGELNVELDDVVMGKLADEIMLLIPKMTLGDLNFSNQPARPKEFPVACRKFNFGVELGCDFLLRNGCLLDCFAGRLYVRESALSSKLQEALDETLREGGYHQINIQTNLGPRLMCKVDMQGGSVPMVINTASSWTWVAGQTAEALGFSYLTNTVADGNEQLLPSMIRVSEIKRLSLGDMTVENFQIVVGEPPEFPSEKGLLGADFLGENQALIDFRNKRMWLRPPDKK